MSRGIVHLPGRLSLRINNLACGEPDGSVGGDLFEGSENVFEGSEKVANQDGQGVRLCAKKCER